VLEHEAYFLEQRGHHQPRRLYGLLPAVHLEYDLLLLV
jgi:hypothetical protein